SGQRRRLEFSSYGKRHERTKRLLKALTDIQKSHDVLVYCLSHSHYFIPYRVGGKLSFNLMLDAVRQKGAVRNKNDTVSKANEKKKKTKKTQFFVIGNPNGPQTTNDEHSSEYSTESAKIAGLGQGHKQSWIRDIIHHEKLSVIGIQETKMEQIDQIFVKSLWVRDNVDFASNGSIGASGGTLTIWNTSIFVKEGVLVGSSFSGAFGKWSGVNETIFLINIYGPQEDHSKEELWDELSCLIESRQGVWILFGNLNAERFVCVNTNNA
ncbi:RNA-directed DNA polymerase, eukaryota, partial [Tanacetum coccineum]